EDVLYYGKWMRDEAEKRIGHLYPKVEVTAEMARERPDLNPYVGQKLTVIAWIWARTVKSPNPAFAQVEVPLAATFMLSTKPGKEAYVEPIIECDGYRLSVKAGRPNNAMSVKEGTKFGRGNFRCLMSGNPIEPRYIKAEAQAGRMGAKLMAIVAEGARGRVYLDPLPEQEAIANQDQPAWKPDFEFFQQALGFRVGNYGMNRWSDLFTNRQLVALTTLSALIGEVQELIRHDALRAISIGASKPLRDGGAGALAYAEAISLYLSFALSKQADLGNNLCRWEPIAQCPRQLFGRQAIPMIWDFAEGNPMGSSSGSWSVFVGGIAKAFGKAFEYVPKNAAGLAEQNDASTQSISLAKVVSTDPPYYDNIGYADLSDFFYVWLRRSMKPVFPQLFATLAVPKAEELVATPAKHGGKESAEAFFLDGMTLAMRRISEQSHPGFPVTIYYAFKQSETTISLGTSSTGWETFLDAVIRADFSISGTWPICTENDSRLRGQSSNALATSVVLVCQHRQESASSLARNDFRRQLRQEMPHALKELERANIAPVDVAQAAIGPGMAIYSSAKAVLNPDDSPMSVREALIEINTALDEYLSQDEGELDADSRFALTFFESYGYEERSYGDAEGLAIARNLSVDGVAEAGILSSVAGKVRLYQRAQLPDDWDPTTDRRLCVWEATQHLIKRLEASGESAAAELLLQLKKVSGHGDLAANCRALAYRLYNHCEKKKQAEEARSYNGLVIAWPELERLASASSTSSSAPRQTTLI
uniref:DUF1156 domain-containing protein n=1 Tax=Synechococcus sp. 8F6 TaxID=2025606 RepID=UPI001303DF0A